MSGREELSLAYYADPATLPDALFTLRDRLILGVKQSGRGVEATNAAITYMRSAVDKYLSMDGIYRTLKHNPFRGMEPIPDYLAIAQRGAARTNDYKGDTAIAQAVQAAKDPKRYTLKRIEGVLRGISHSYLFIPAAIGILGCLRVSTNCAPSTAVCGELGPRATVS